MNDQTIKCPACGTNISIDASLKKQAQEEVKEKLEELEQNFEKKVEEETRKKSETQIKDLEAQLKESSHSLKSAQRAELELRKKAREVHEKEKSLELEVLKKVEAETKNIEQKVMRASSHNHKYEILQKDKMIQQMKDKTEDLQRKLSEGSQQAKGEVVEEDFEQNLKLKFPSDIFEEVPKGINGADLLQTVKDSTLKKCGQIIWEFKNVKTYSNSWVAKLREDQRKIGANIAVLVTRALPKDAADIELIDGVYQVSYEVAIPFCVSLRKTLEELTRAQLITTNKDEKMVLIYKYLTGPIFKQKFRSIINSYKMQKEQLEQEKRSLTRIWSKREKQLEIVIESATSMFGDVEAIIGNELPIIEELALPAES